MKADCTFAESLSPYIDGELPAKEAERVRMHLNTCAGCQSRFDKLSFLDRQLAAMPPMAPGPDFDSALWKKIDALEEKKRRWKAIYDFFGSRARGWRPILAAAVGVLILCTTVLLTQVHEGQRLSADEMAISANLEFYEDYDIVCLLDMLEDWTEISENGEPADA